MLLHRAVLDLIHCVQLALEQVELTGLGGALVQNAVLELLKRVDHLEEVALTEEELEVLLACLLWRYEVDLSYR